MSDNSVKLSKFLSLILRHQPEKIGLTLDAQGWTCIDMLIDKSRAAGQDFDRAALLQIVANSDKQRFTLSADGLSIRAAQGHSVDVALGLPPQPPPTTLYHGTARRFLGAIKIDGLLPQSRRQVHLSTLIATAWKVGQRHGQPVILQVAAAQMAADGHLFFQADNGVWLTDRVPAKYLTVLDDATAKDD